MSTTEPRPLVSCPFCGGDEVGCVTHGLNGSMAITCSGCCVRTAWYGLDSDAVSAWNTRALAVEPPPVGTREPLIVVLDWMCNRPGASWVATIQDIMRAADALDMDLPFKWDDRARQFIRLAAPECDHGVPIFRCSTCASPSAAGGVTEQERSLYTATEDELEGWLKKVEAKLVADGIDSDVMAVRGTLLMQPEPTVRAALSALDRIQARLAGAEQPRTVEQELKAAMLAGANAIVDILDHIDDDAEFKEAQAHVITLRTAAVAAPEGSPVASEEAGKVLATVVFEDDEIKMKWPAPVAEPRTPSERETLEHLRNLIQDACDNGHEASWADDAAAAVLAALRTVAQPAPTRQQVEALRWRPHPRKGVDHGSIASHWNAAIDTVLALYGESAQGTQEGA